MISSGRNFKEIERKKIESKSEQKHSENRAKIELCEISQPKENLCEMSFLLPNHSATLWDSLRDFSQLRRRVWHTSATSQHMSTHFAAVKRIAKRKSLIRTKSPIPQGISQLRKWFWHTCATSQHSTINFAAAKRIAKWLRNWHFVAKLKLTLSFPLFLFIPVIWAAKRVSK